MITFVTCYIEPPPLARPKIPSASRISDPERMITAMFASAELLHPGCHKVVLTDAATALNLPPDIKVQRLNFNPLRLELSLLKAYSAYLKQCVIPAHHVFLHYDMLVVGELNSVFTSKFDLALAYKEADLQIFKSSIFFVPAKREKIASRLFLAIAENMTSNHPRFLTWGGIAISLLSFIDPLKFIKNKAQPMVVHKFNFYFLKSNLYDFVPNDDLERNYKKVIHFQEDRKQLFWSYWERYLKPKLPPTSNL